MTYLKIKEAGKRFSRLALIVALLAMGSGCGYRLNASTYNLNEPMQLSIPAAKNKTDLPELGPEITRLMIKELSGAPQITILPADDKSQAVLNLTIARLELEGGAWEVDRNDLLASVSRRVLITVEAVLERPAPDGGQARITRRSITVNRNYQVASNQAQLEINQANAADLALKEASKKIAVALFNEF